MNNKPIFQAIVLRVLFLVLTCLGFAFALVVKNRVDIPIYLGIIIVFQTVFLIKFINVVNRKIAFFLNAVENDDSAIYFPETSKNKSIKALHASLNKLNVHIQKVKIKNKTQDRFYHTILEQASTGVLAINSKGHIILANKTAKRLLNYDTLTHVEQLKRVDHKLFNHISKLQPFEQKLIDLPNERTLVKLTIKATPIRIEDDDMLLVIIQNISNELNDNEVDSWVKVFRVLAHEIMNNIAPITSISETLSDTYVNNGVTISANNITNDDIFNTVKGLSIIEQQSNVLIDFVESYRKLIKIPNPKKELINVKTLFEKIRILASQETEFNDIQFKIAVIPETLDVFADDKQLTQVLLNLTKNALQSLNGRTEAMIKLSGEKDSFGKTILKVIDNGKGVPTNLLDQIFIPFFTTKEKGTGIGLSLSKHIIKLHGGSVYLESIPNVKTTFTVQI